MPPRLPPVLSPATLAAALALALTACGGGGGGAIKSNPPPTGPTTPPPAPTCADPKAANYGGPLPCVYRYNGPQDNHLVPTNVDLAQQAGFTGKGVKVGLLDTARIEPYPTLQPAWYQDYTGGTVTSEDYKGHGNVVGAILAGKPGAALTSGGTFKGGVAPDADLYWAATCNPLCDLDRVKPAIYDMAALGVRLFNASFGGEADDDPQKVLDAARGYAYWLGDPVRDTGALLVNAAGNEGKKNPSAQAALPAVDARIREQWLAVASVVIDADGKPAGLASYSNWCGLAQDWCLVAPGKHYFPVPSPGTYAAGYAEGTSGATGIVSGVAALVWQAFPWMSASNVQTTLLTTATDLGDPGVDAMYGWGLVNAAKAVRGPGQFLDAFDANVTSGSYTFANAIGGSGSLTKRGAGTLTLSGDNTYTGLTAITGGTLALTGKLAGSVSVGSGATFQTSGGRIGGSYAAQAGATTAVQVGNGFTVGGTASLAGDLLLLPEAQGYSVKPQETILTAGSVAGTFANLRYGSGLWWTGTLSYTPTTVVANLQRAQAAAQVMSLGGTPLTVAGAAQADALVKWADARAAAGATWEDDASLQAAARLMGITSVEATLPALESLTGRTQAVGQSLALREALDDGRLLADRAVLAREADKAGAWVQANGQWGRLSGHGGVGADTTRSGLVVGVDGPVRDGLVLGAALGAGKDKATLDAGAGRIDGDRVTVAAYARKQVGQAGYVSAVVAADRVKQDAVRAVGGVLGDVARMRRTDRSAQARIEGGVQAGAYNPFAAAGIVHLEQGAFAETGSDLGLVAGKDRHDLPWAEVGLRWNAEAGAWEWSADLSGRWLLAGVDPAYRAAFVAAPQAGFDVVGLPLDRFAVRGGLTVTYRPTERVLWYVRGAAESASGSRNGSVSAGVRVAW